MHAIARLALLAAAIPAVALFGSTIARLPRDASVRHAESAASCPITVDAYGLPFATEIAQMTEENYESTRGGVNKVNGVVRNAENPGSYFDSGNPRADVVFTAEPLLPSQVGDKYQFPVGKYMWAAVRDTAGSPRFDNSDYVLADDWLNYMFTPSAQDVLHSYGHPTYSNPDAIPDWDVNLDGSLQNILDLGAVAARWGQESPCRGWIRSDADNSGNVNLADIGVVARHWGNSGFGCEAYLPSACRSTHPWSEILQARIRPYAFKNSSCTANELDGDADPIGLVIRMQEDPESHLEVHGLADDITDTWNNLPGNLFEKGTYFYDNGACIESEIVRGDVPGNVNCGGALTWCLQDRLHVRGHRQELWDPQYGDLHITPLTPHYDDAITELDVDEYTLCGDSYNQNGITVKYNHVIRQDFWRDGSNVSGFTAARDLVAWNWRTSGHHLDVAVLENWEDTDERPQCNGDRPHADGIVYMLGKCGETSIQSPYCQ